MKVVWICNFSNKEVRDQLPLFKGGGLRQFVSKIVPINPLNSYNDYAPWITNSIKEINKLNLIELHVISPHVGLLKNECSFILDNVHYYFYSPDMPFLHRRWPEVFEFDAIVHFFSYRQLVKKIVNSINPDIIHLYGAENAYYSSTIINLKKYPVLICIQGIYSNPERSKYFSGKLNKYHIKYERLIHSKFKYFTIGAKFFPELIRRDNPNPILYHYRLPINESKNIEKTPINDKIYDFVFFARQISNKGPEDFIQAISIIKQYKTDVNARMMGPIEKTYQQKLISIIKEHKLQDNINLTDGYEMHEDLLKEASLARIYVLPTKIDTIPGTLLEAVHLGLPVISYNTGDIPWFNQEKESIILCDKNDINTLAYNMITLLNDNEKQKELMNNATAFVDKYFNNEKNAMLCIDLYREVIAVENGKPVNEELLYENIVKF